MNISRDILSLTEFKRNTGELVKQMKETGSPLVLTVNGRAELVVLDAENYQAMLDQIEQVETVKAVRESMAAFERGEGRPARAALEELRAKHDIPR
jgi:prevent-host-death family protein